MGRHGCRGGAGREGTSLREAVLSLVLSTSKLNVKILPDARLVGIKNWSRTFFDIVKKTHR